MPGVPGINTYTSVAASNVTWFPEGQAPSTVNDGMRQVQADIRAWYTDAQWVNWGDTPSRASATTFKIATDVTARYTVNSRLKMYDATTFYGVITASSYGAPDTTVTVVTDSGSLTTSLTSVALSIISPTNLSIPTTIGRKGADIASATTTDIGAGTGDYVDVTGTTTITGLGTIASGVERTVRFTGALTLTHNGTSLILPGAANITTAANDTAMFRSLGSGNWLCILYSAAAGATADAPKDAQYVTLATNATLTVERVLTAGSGIYLTDAGAGSTLTVASTMQFISSATASASASLTFTGLTSAYSQYVFVLSHMRPATDDVELWIRTSTDGGSTYDSGAGTYAWQLTTGYSATSVSAYGSASDTKIGMTSTSATWGTDNAAASAVCGTVRLNNPSAALNCKLSFDTVYGSDAGGNHCVAGGGRRIAAADVDAIQFLFESGNITSGTIYMYGIKNT